VINQLRAKASTVRDNWAEYFSTAEHRNIAEKAIKENKALSDKANDSKSLDRTTSKQDVYTPIVVSMEVSMTDVVMKSITANVESIADSLGKQVNKSDELAKEWKSNISNLDTFIKGLSTWKRVIGYTACLLTIGAFLWKMGALRAIPNFLSNMINIVPAILPSGDIHPVKEISKEGMNYDGDSSYAFNDCSQYWYSHLRNRNFENNSMDITTYSKIIMILTLFNSFVNLNTNDLAGQSEGYIISLISNEATLFILGFVLNVAFLYSYYYPYNPDLKKKKEEAAKKVTESLLLLSLTKLDLDRYYSKEEELQDLEKNSYQIISLISLTSISSGRNYTASGDYEISQKDVL
jgi:hypothetical protein